MSVCILVRVAFAAVLLLAGATFCTSQRTFIVDGSATGCAGAPCQDSNNGLTEATAFATPTGCITALRAGDTCLIKNGLYIPATAPTERYRPGFNFATSGNSTHKITIKNFPGHRPRFCSVVGCVANQVGPTIGTFGGSYLHFEGLVVQGGLSIWSSRYSRVTGCEATGGWDCDGNFSIMRVEDSSYIQIDYNYVHSIEYGSCTGFQSSASGLKLFCAQNSVFEYNTFEIFNGVYSIDDKDSSYYNTHRYNEFFGGGLRLNAQVRDSAQNELCPGVSRNTVVYGNIVAHIAGQAFKIDERTFNVSIFSNTVVNTTGLQLINNDIFAISFYDNIMANASLADPPYRIHVAVEDSWPTFIWSNTSKFDYNVYDSNGYWIQQRYVSGTYNHDTLSSWGEALQTGFGGVEPCGTSTQCGGELNSRVLSCEFSQIGTKWTINGGSCASGSSTGGQPGAWGVTNCIGRFCGSYFSPVTVEAPTATAQPPSASANTPSASSNAPSAGSSTPNASSKPPASQPSSPPSAKSSPTNGSGRRYAAMGLVGTTLTLLPLLF